MDLHRFGIPYTDNEIKNVIAAKSYKDGWLNERILEKQMQSNAQLNDLVRQQSEANEMNAQLLEIQVREEKRKQEQKYYKDLSFHLHETVDLIARVNDKVILNYVLSNYYDRVKTNLNEATQVLEEVEDKTFNKQTLIALEGIRANAEASAPAYKASVLSRVDGLIADFRTGQQHIAGMQAPVRSPQKQDRSGVGYLRKTGIVILSIMCGLFCLAFIPSMSPSLVVPITGLLVFGTPLFLLFKAERKWKAEGQSISDVEQLALEKEFNENVARGQEALSKHPLHTALAEIKTAYPAFDGALSELAASGKAFNQKWGVQ